MSSQPILLWFALYTIQILYRDVYLSAADTYLNIFSIVYDWLIKRDSGFLLAVLEGTFARIQSSKFN